MQSNVDMLNAKSTANWGTIASILSTCIQRSQKARTWLWQQMLQQLASVCVRTNLDDVGLGRGLVLQVLQGRSLG